MQAGTIEWNGTDLSRLGKPSLTIRRMPDPPPPAQATRELVSLVVRVALEANDPSTLQARLSHLQASMKASEGELRSISPGGNVLSWNAIPAGDTLGEAISGRSTVVDLEFTATEAHQDTSNLVSATFTPDGGESIALHSIREWRQSISTDHHSPLAAGRRLTTVTLSFTARVMQASAADSPAQRLAALVSKEIELRAINSRQGVLEHGGESNVVRVQTMTPSIDEGRHALDLAIQCFYTVFPDESQGEASLTIESRDGEGEERIISISGAVEAATEEIARAKVDSIRARHTTSGRKLVSLRAAPVRIDGADTAGNELWSGTLAFSMDYREITADAERWTLRVSSRQDSRSGMRYSYSGTVKAATAEAALAKARSLGGSAPHLFRVSAEETLDTASAPGASTSQLVGLAFSYEYEAPASNFIFAEITSDRAKPLYGEWQTSVSGFVVAPDSTWARFFIESLFASYSARTPVDVNERESELSQTLGTADTVRAAVRLEFSRTYPDAHTRLAAKYSEEVTTEYASMTSTTTISGTIYTDTRAHAETAFSALLTAIFGAAVPTQMTKGHPQEKWGNEGVLDTFNSSRWIQMDFSASKTSKVTGTPGFDIMEARFTATRTGATNKAIIHQIPFGRPVAQAGVGWTIPTFRISASCKSRTESAGRTWCQGTRSKGSAAGGGIRHEIEDPQESVSVEFEEFSGTTVLFYVWSANYSFGYSGTTGTMDGIWPASLTVG